MKKISLFFAGFLLLFFTANLLANPQYYNSNTGTVQNSFPFNIATGKMIQTLVAAGEFNQPSGAPSGNITSVSFWMGSAQYPLTTTTYTNFRILFLDTNLTTLPTSLVTGNWDTVYFRASIAFTAASTPQWLDIPLDHPHAYSNTRGLLIQIEQCAAVGATSGVFSLTHTNTTGMNRRTYSTAGCPFTYGGTSTYVTNCGINVSTGPGLPELIYYKFENNPAPLQVRNCATTAPVGNNPAVLGSASPLTSAGQFDTCIQGVTTPGPANLGGVNSGWNTVLPANWTISFWLGPNIVDGNPSYIFGDPGATAFRCFYGGAAGANNILLRGAGLTDVLITGVGITSTVVTIVWDGTNIVVYKNGVLFQSFPRTMSSTAGTGFYAGSYNTTLVSQLIGKFDEFRLYNRALNAGEVTATWNVDLGGCGVTVGVNGNNSEVPSQYKLSQNYPNPFNPVTKISYSLPIGGLTRLVIYDLLGREVATLVDAFKSAGNHEINFDASHLASGVYLYRLESANFVDSKKMTLVK